MNFKLTNKIELAAGMINRGKVIVVPTDTVYGLAAAFNNYEACNKIYQIKQRPAGMPLIVMIASLEDLCELVAEIPAVALTLMRRLWPGALTLIFKKKPGLNLNGEHDTIGVRFANNEVLNQLIIECGQPLAVTSANLNGAKTPVTASDIDKKIISQVDFMLEMDEEPEGRESTIVDVSTDNIRIIRAGVISEAVIFQEDN